MWTVDEKSNKGAGVVDGRDENCGFGKTVVLEVRVRRRWRGRERDDKVERERSEWDGDGDAEGFLDRGSRVGETKKKKVVLARREKMRRGGGVLVETGLSLGCWTGPVRFFSGSVWFPFFPFSLAGFYRIWPDSSTSNICSIFLTFSFKPFFPHLFKICKIK